MKNKIFKISTKISKILFVAHVTNVPLCKAITCLDTKSKSPNKDECFTWAIASKITHSINNHSILKFYLFESNHR
jgi:hypothetical protein